MSECEYCVDEICVNADCPLVADFCPVSDSPDECYYSETTEDRTEVRTEVRNEDC